MTCTKSISVQQHKKIYCKIMSCSLISVDLLGGKISNYSACIALGNKFVFNILNFLGHNLVLIRY